MITFIILASLYQSGPTPDTWVDALSKGSPYVLAIIIVALMSGILVPKWVYSDLKVENKILQTKLDEANSLILDLLRKGSESREGSHK